MASADSRNSISDLCPEKCVLGAAKILRRTFKLRDSLCRSYEFRVLVEGSISNTIVGYKLLGLTV